VLANCCLLTVSQIGQGNFARVYLAEEMETGGQYALKVVGPTEPSFDSELGILRTIAAEVRPQA
jgi:serine/threonine protein kinase